MNEQVKPTPRAYQANVFWDQQDCATLSAQVYLASDADSYIDALHAEAEALRVHFNAMQLQRNHHRGLAAKLRTDLEAARAENERLSRQKHEADTSLAWATRHYESLTTQLAAARGLLERVHDGLEKGHPLLKVGDEIRAFLTATPAPEVQAEQGERQEAVARVGMVPGTDFKSLDFFKTDLQELPVGTMLYTTPQPGPDVRGLAAFALELIDGAWEGGSFDGGDIQEAGVRHGLLTVEQRQESCGEHCACAEYGFPSECYRLTPALAAHRQAQRKGDHP